RASLNTKRRHLSRNACNSPAILIMAASIGAGQSWDLRLPYASLRVTLRVGTQKQPTFMHLLTGLRLQHPPRGNSATVSVTIVAVLLLPACVGALSTLWHVLRASGKADTIWAAALAGAGCWLAIYLLLPKPMWVYVFGHELTHALWTWLLGGRVKKFKASAKGGHVLVTRNNFVV